MSEPVFIGNIEKVGKDALDLAQFGFSFAPLSVNKYLVPVISRKTNIPVPVMQMSSDAQRFKQNIYKAIRSAMVRESSRAYGWECLNRKYSFWIILKKGDKRVEKLDTDNCHKLLQDAFVNAGVNSRRHARNRYTPALCRFQQVKRPREFRILRPDPLGQRGNCPQSPRKDRP